MDPQKLKKSVKIVMPILNLCLAATLIWTSIALIKTTDQMKEQSQTFSSAPHTREKLELCEDVDWSKFEPTPGSERLVPLDLESIGHPTSPHQKAVVSTEVPSRNIESGKPAKMGPVETTGSFPHLTPGNRYVATAELRNTKTDELVATQSREFIATRTEEAVTFELRILDSKFAPELKAHSSFSIKDA